MIPLILSAMFAVHLGPMSPDAPAREPQLAANASTVVLAFGAGAYSASAPAEVYPFRRSRKACSWGSSANATTAVP